MWNSWAEQARKGLTDALEKTGDALEKTGDAITKAASNTNPRSRTAPPRPRPVDLSTPRNLESMPAEEVAGVTSTGAGRSPAIMMASSSPDSAASTSPTNNNNNSGGILLNPSEIRARAAAALAKVQATEETVAKSAAFQNLQKGWSNVVDSAKKGVQAAQEAVEKEQSRLELLLHQRDVPKYFSRDLNLPLDVPALKDAEVVYVTDRIISMSHPALPSTHDHSITGERKLAAVCHLLEKRHGSGNVMVWNLSEVTTYHQHASAVLERVGPVLAFSFPGSPAPPLGLWLQLLLSLEKWLQASPDNVAVVHCLTGKGRTSTVVAAFLCWMAEAGFEKTNMTSALQYVAQCKKMPVDELTIPSQRRYAQYFTNMLEGIRPSQPPLVLKRIIMSEAPHFALGPPVRKQKEKADDNKSGTANTSNSSPEDNDNGSDQVGENKDRMGCAPYLQVFQAGQLLHTVAATLHFQQLPEALPFCQVADGSIAFHVDQVIQGDVLIRSRHLAHSTKQKISMFRAAFHTGYAPPNVLRFTKPQLDGACNDPRFPDDFFVDLILEPCSTEQASEFYQHNQEELKRKEKEAAETDEKTIKDAVVSASTYDSMLHRDSRFWDVIADHLKGSDDNNNGNKKEGESEENADKDSEKAKDPAKARMWGPTVGKRRVFTSTPQNSSTDANASAEGKSDSAGNNSASQAPLQTFSIGGELDFLPEPEKKAAAAKPKQPPKKDSLMEALMGALGDESAAQETEEIVFDDSPSEPAPFLTQPQPTIVALPPLPASATTISIAPAATDSSSKAQEVPTGGDAAAATKTITTETIEFYPAAADGETGKVPPPQHQESTATTQSMNEMKDLLATDSEDVDVDALLADGDDDDGDFNLDDYNVDDEDAELEDLENFLSQK